MSNPNLPQHLKAMFTGATRSLEAISRSQLHRTPWPDWGDFDPRRYDPALRRAAAAQWSGRAVNEHSSIHQFSTVTQVVCEARLPLSMSGGLARLITDEVRHAELCGRLALTLYPEAQSVTPATLPWPAPTLPWRSPPRGGDRRELLIWIAEALLVACCFGETLSVPMLQALSTVCTEPLSAAVADQILRDEHLHARYGWESLQSLLDELGEEGRVAIQATLPENMVGFERTCCRETSLADVIAAPELTIEPGDSDHPNLGVLTDRQYAVIFYATLEQEIFPKLDELGLDPAAAWRKAHSPATL